MRYSIFPMVLTAGFFVFLLALGRAFFALTKIRMRGVACWLLSPAMGLAVLGLLAGWLNQAGLPVHAFGSFLAVILAVASVLVLWWRKCRLPWKRLSAGAVIVLLWLGAAGYPLIRYGSDWLSFVNNDFANYCVGAARLLNHGFFELPTESQVHGQDLPAIYWFMHVAASARPVTDFVLAVVSAAGRTPPREAFMPVILVFALAQAGALGGLLALSHRFRNAAATSMAVLLLSPLFILGVYYQLFAQVGGLSLLLLALALLVRSVPEILWRNRLSCVLPCAVAIAALMWFYPECAPFALIPAAVMQMMALVRQPALRRRLLQWASLVSILVVGLLHINVPMIVSFLAQQLGHGASSANNDIFPYFLNEDGWVRTMGWTPFYSQVPRYLWMVALAFVIAAFAMLVRNCKVLQGLAGVALVMMLMTVSLVGKQNGFGLFKMAMFAQPVLAAGLTLLWRAMPSKKWRAALAACWMASTLPASWNYQSYALGKPGGPCEAPFASQLGFPSAIKEKGSCKIINMGAGLEKLAVLSLPGRLFDPPPLSFSTLFWGSGKKSAYFEQEKQQIVRMIAGDFVQAPDGMNLLYFVPSRSNAERTPRFLMEPHPVLRPFNRFFDQAKKSDWFSTGKINSWANQNRLALVPSASREELNAEGRVHQVHFQGIKVEQDVADSSRTFWGAGRHMLFEVIQSTPEVYLRVAFTRTYCGLGRVLLPGQAFVRGKNQESLHFAGSGAANVIVGPLKPTQDKGKALVSIDLGAPAQQLFKGDPRYLCGWIRDVSALSPERYRQLIRPSALQTFPEDLLKDPALEYSGIYEDGMIDQTSWVGLATTSGEQPSGLLLEGEIPPLPGLENGNRLAISMDGVPLREIEVAPGYFKAFVTLPAPTKDWARFELKWGRVSRLPEGDGRPAAARLLSIGVLPIK